MITHIEYFDSDLILYIENNILKFYKNTDNLFFALHNSVFHNVKNAFVSDIDNELILTIHKLDDSVIQYDSESKYYNSYYDVKDIKYTNTNGFFILFTNGYINFSKHKIKIPEIVKISNVKFIDYSYNNNIEGFFAQIQNNKLIYWGISNNKKFFNYIFCLSSLIKFVYSNHSKIFIILNTNELIEYNNPCNTNLHSITIKHLLYNYEYILKIDENRILTNVGRLINYTNNFIESDYVLLYDKNVIVDKDNNIIELIDF